MKITSNELIIDDDKIEITSDDCEKLYDKFNYIRRKFSLIRKAAVVRNLENIDLYMVLTTVAEKNEIACFTLLFSYTFDFLSNNIEEFSEKILDFHDSIGENRSEEDKKTFNENIIYTVIGITTYYYFSFLKMKCKELSTRFPFVEDIKSEDNIYYHSTDPIDYIDESFLDKYGEL